REEGVATTAAVQLDRHCARRFAALQRGTERDLHQVVHSDSLLARYRHVLLHELVGNHTIGLLDAIRDDDLEYAARCVKNGPDHMGAEDLYCFTRSVSSSRCPELGSFDR